MAQLLGVKVAEDEALKSLRSGLAFSDIGFLDKGREGLEKAHEISYMVLMMTPSRMEAMAPVTGLLHDGHTGAGIMDRL